MPDLTEITEHLSELGVPTKRVASTNGGEYHGPCPFCGGEDRFIIQPFNTYHRHGSYMCRKCRMRGDLNDLIKTLQGRTVGADQAWQNPDYNPSSSYTGPRQHQDQVKSPPSEEWQKAMGAPLAQMQGAHDATAPFLLRRITKETAKRNGLCWTPKKTFVSVEGEKICIPAGMIIPIHRAGKLFGIRVRTFEGASKYVYVKGSSAIPYLISYQNDLTLPVIVVESELDAILIMQEAGDLVNAVALCSAQNKPDKLIHALLEETSHILVCLDYDDAGKMAWDWWEKHYPGAHRVFTPTGKDIGEYALSGGDVRTWLKSVISQAENEGSVPERPFPQFKPVTITDRVQAEQVVAELAEIQEHLGIMLKWRTDSSSSQDPRLSTPTLLTVASNETVYLFDLKVIPAEALSRLAACQLVTYNAANQLPLLHLLGLEIFNMDCVLLQLNANANENWSLEKLSQFRLGYGSGYLNPDFEAEEYTPTEFCAAAIESFAVLQIFHIHYQKLIDSDRDNLYRLMKSSAPAISQIQEFGIPFDWKKHLIMYTILQEDIERSEPSSHNVQSIRTHLNTWGTSFEKYRSPITDRVHPVVTLNATPTGRFSTKTPNMQGMPKKLDFRSLCAPPDGYVLVGADYSQIDLRVAAEISEDPIMLEAIRTGTDLHLLTASAIYGVDPEEVTSQQREVAKTENYKLIYGGESSYQTSMKHKFPTLFSWREQQVPSWNSLFMHTPSNRRIMRDFTKGRRPNTFFNYPVQGGASEVLFAALGILPFYLDGLDAFLIHCIHDELILEAAEQDAHLAADALERAMTDGFLTIFPEAPTTNLVTAKIGANWGDLK